jgi:ribosomal protein S2
MAAAIKAINAKIRSNKVLDYVCSTHFWGPASNFGIPIAAVMDTQKDPEMYVVIAPSSEPRDMIQ